MLSPLPISIIVHTRNSATTLKKCLSSLPEVKELLVVDMESTDETLVIARQFHARTMTVADVGFVEPARMIAIEQATEPWIFIVDADEQLPPNATAWLSPLLEEKIDTIFSLPRRNIIFNHPMTATGWWPDYQVRLFKKGEVTWNKSIHSQPNCRTKPKKLPATDQYAIIHHNYHSIDQFLERMNRYTTIEAQSSTQSDGALDWMTAQMGELYSRLVARDGWQDGEHGLAISILQSMYPVVTRLKKWEAGGYASRSEFKLDVSQQLNEMKHILAYWHTTYQMTQSSGLTRFYWQLRRKLQL